MKLVENEISQLPGQGDLVLAPAPASHYRFFNSRGKSSYPVKASISELTNIWLNAIFDEEVYCYPRVWLAQSELSSAQLFIRRLRQSESIKIICINLGVGGNSRKCLSRDFEAGLVLRLLQDQQVKILLDMGFGEEEQSRNEKILNWIRLMPAQDL